MKPRPTSDRRIRALLSAIVASMVPLASTCDQTRDVRVPSEELFEEHEELRTVLGTWAHAFEEDAGDQVVYRAVASLEAEAESPFRGSVSFEADGNCRRRVQASEQAPYFEDCGWVVRASDPFYISVEDGRGTIAEMRFLEGTDERLRFEMERGDLHAERPPVVPGGGGW